jgi:elongation factor P
MPKACELKRGVVVEINGENYLLRQVEAKSPSSRGAQTLYKMRFNHVQTKQKLEQSFKGDDFLKDVDLIKRPVQYSYKDGDLYNFMDSEDFVQYSLSSLDLEGQLDYLTEGLEGIIALLIDEQIIAIELPQSIHIVIKDTAPALKGATATGRTKPAILETGLEIQVPEYLAVGEIVKINTATGKFMSRA